MHSEVTDQGHKGLYTQHLTIHTATLLALLLLFLVMNHCKAANCKQILTIHL